MGLWNKHQQNVLPACCHGVAHYVGWCEFPVLEPETNITDQDFKQMRTAGNQTLPRIRRLATDSSFHTKCTPNENHSNFCMQFRCYYLLSRIRGKSIWHGNYHCCHYHTLRFHRHHYHRHAKTSTLTGARTCLPRLHLWSI